MMSEVQKADFKILRDGSWLHEGVKITRRRLAKLFADRALKRDEDGNYWLQTPFEKYPVEVEDVPFVIVDYETDGAALNLRTNMDDIIELGPDSVWELRGGVPYVEVRGGLFARVARAVLYNLVEEYGAKITSRGANFPLGEMH